MFKQQLPDTNLFVKGFDKEWSHQDLHEAFCEFGEVTSARVSITESYESRGFGYIQYKTAEAAKMAILKLDGKEKQGGDTLSVSYFKTS